MYWRMKPIYLILVIGLALTPVYAEEKNGEETQAGESQGQEAEAPEEDIPYDPDEVIDLGEIVVTATRTNKNIFDTPVQTEVIGEEFIEDSGADSLDDLFESVGMQYAESGMGSHIQLQGMEGERVLILIDGKKITGRVAGNLVANTIPIDSIKRVEVIRGPQSALYGSEAIGGVINIITKKPGRNVSGGFSVKNNSLPVSEGSDGTWKSILREQTVSGYINFPLGPTNHRISVFGGRAFPYLDQYDVSILPDYSQGKASLDSDVPLGVSTLLTFGGEFSYHQSDDQTSSGGSFDRIDTQRARTYATLDQNFGNMSSLSFTAYHNYFFRDKSQYSSIFDEWYGSGTEREHLIGLDAIFSHYFSKHNEFTTAVTYLYNQMSKYNIQNSELQRRHTVSLVLQDEQFRKGKYSIMPGVRAEYSNDYGFFASPKLSTMFYIGKVFRVLPSVGLGYRAPTFLELYLDTAGDIFHKFGNPDLKAEKSLGFNLGLEFFPKNVTLKANLFQSELFDEIVYDYTDQYDGGLQIIVKKNLSRSSRTGVDFTGTVSPLSFLDVQGQYGFLYAYNRITETQLLNQPMHTVSGRLKVWFDSIGLGGHVEGKFQTPHERNEQYNFILDVYVSKKIGKFVEAFAGIDNITGQTDEFAIYLFGPIIYAGVNGTF